MGVVIFCDGGCGATAKDPAEFQELGVINMRPYCSSCAQSVEKYLSDRDMAQERLCKQWQEFLEKLNKAWKDDHPGGVLPDE